MRIQFKDHGALIHYDCPDVLVRVEHRNYNEYKTCYNSAWYNKKHMWGHRDRYYYMYTFSSRKVSV